MNRVYLSLGSNLGNPVANLRTALRMLGTKGVAVRRVSSFYKTEPRDYRAQPWFTNCVAEVWTALAPLRLLRTVRSIERALGRRPGTSKGPRVIDIDILLYEDQIARTGELTIPHERMSRRCFVLIPLHEIAPAVRHPVSRRTPLEMLRRTRDNGRVVRLKDNHER